MYAVVMTVRIDPARTQEAMEDLATMVQPPPEAAAQVERIGTYEVHAEA